MNDHTHMEYAEGCFRCQVALDELNEHAGGNENPEPVQPNIEPLQECLLRLQRTFVVAGWKFNAVLDARNELRAQRATIEKLRMWLKSVEWVQGQDGRLRCPKCKQQFRHHDPQCNWVKDRAALGEGE